MALPRVFVSSTYYDLKHVRNEINDFIKNLGYDAVLHDKGQVAYTQDRSLEQSCYQELSNCDIVVCIIGSKYGTKSMNSDYSITMEELKKAIAQRKKIYIYIQKDVAIENKTFVANRDVSGFKTVYADDIKIHTFICELKENIQNNPIIEFENVTDIVENLRTQFAGMFQFLLRQESTLTEEKTFYDLKSTSDEIKSLITDMREQNENFVGKLGSSILLVNRFLTHLEKSLGLEGARIIIRDRKALQNFLKVMGFEYRDKFGDEHLYYERDIHHQIQEIKISKAVFDENDKLKIILNNNQAEELLGVTIKRKNEAFSGILPDEDIPF